MVVWIMLCTVSDDDDGIARAKRTAASRGEGEEEKRCRSRAGWLSWRARSVTPARLLAQRKGPVSRGHALHPPYQLAAYRPLHALPPISIRKLIYSDTQTPDRYETRATIYKLTYGRASLGEKGEPPLPMGELFPGVELFFVPHPLQNGTHRIIRGPERVKGIHTRRYNFLRPGVVIALRSGAGVGTRPTYRTIYISSCRSPDQGLRGLVLCGSSSVTPCD